MQLVICPHCDVRVAAMADGNCPSCRRLIDQLPNDKAEVSETNSCAAKSPTDSRALTVYPTRPTSITVIAWFLVVIGSLNLIFSTANINNPLVRELMAKRPLPVPIQLAMLYVGLSVMILCGVAMLRGHNWARWLYVIWTLVGTIVTFATSPMKVMLIPGLVVFLVIVFFLFRSNSSLYFSQFGARDE